MGLQFTLGHPQRGRLPSPTPLHICPNMDMCVRFPGQALGRTRILGGFYWSFIYERFLQSFSEDEDAPSPLTRRLSALNLSRRASASSIMSASGLGSGAPWHHPLARSYSHGTVLESEVEHDFDLEREYDEYDDFNDDEEDHTISKSGEWA